MLDTRKLGTKDAEINKQKIIAFMNLIFWQ